MTPIIIGYLYRGGYMRTVPAGLLNNHYHTCDGETQHASAAGMIIERKPAIDAYSREYSDFKNLSSQAGALKNKVDVLVIDDTDHVKEQDQTICQEIIEAIAQHQPVLVISADPNPLRFSTHVKVLTPAARDAMTAKDCQEWRDEWSQRVHKHRTPSVWEQWHVFAGHLLTTFSQVKKINAPQP